MLENGLKFIRSGIEQGRMLKVLPLFAELITRQANFDPDGKFCIRWCTKLELALRSSEAKIL